MVSTLGNFMDELLRDHLKNQMRIRHRDEVVIIDDNAHLTPDNRLMNARIFSRTCSSSSHLANRWCSEPSSTSRQSSISPIPPIRSNRGFAPRAEQKRSENENTSICEDVAKTTPLYTPFAGDLSPRTVAFMDNRLPKRSLDFEAPQAPRRFLSPQPLKQVIACQLVNRQEMDSKFKLLEDAIGTSRSAFLLLERRTMTTFSIMGRAIQVC